MNNKKILSSRLAYEKGIYIIKQNKKLLVQSLQSFNRKKGPWNEQKVY